MWMLSLSTCNISEIEQLIWFVQSCKSLVNWMLVFERDLVLLDPFKSVNFNFKKDSESFESLDPILPLFYSFKAIHQKLHVLLVKCCFICDKDFSGVSISGVSHVVNSLGQKSLFLIFVDFINSVSALSSLYAWLHNSSFKKTKPPCFKHFLDNLFMALFKWTPKTVQ